MFFVQEHYAPRKVDRKAIFSDDRLYRLALGRTWDWNKPRLYVCMCNPSDASEDCEDPTSHRVNGFAERWGYGGWGGVNLFGLVSPDPKVLDTHPEPGGPGNQAMLQHVLFNAKRDGLPVLAAWGNNGARAGRDRQFIMQARRMGVELICLGMTQHGHPKHPLARGVHRVPDDFEPIPFDPPWWGQVKIGHYTCALHPDGQPICARCNGTKRSPSVVNFSSRGPHDVSDVCALCKGTGVHPNPFGDPS